VYAGNLRAIRSYEKAGFSLEGRLREAVYKRGAYDDVLIMSVLRSEWDAGRK
jgi:RimJ/RimL family protein N-acetyltransferase